MWTAYTGVRVGEFSKHNGCWMLALYFLSSLFCGIVAWINSLILPWLFVLPTSKTIKSPNNELRITGLSDNSWHSFFCFILCPVGGPRLSYFQSSYPFHTSFMFIIVELSFCPVAYLAFVTPAVPWPTTSPSSKKKSIFCWRRGSWKAARGARVKFLHARSSGDFSLHQESYCQKGRTLALG